MINCLIDNQDVILGIFIGLCLGKILLDNK